MQVLWAPWRMEYIHSDNKMEDCIFCPGVDRSKDEDRLILYVGELTMVMMTAKVRPGLLTNERQDS